MRQVRYFSLREFVYNYFAIRNKSLNVSFVTTQNVQLARRVFSFHVEMFLLLAVCYFALSFSKKKETHIDIDKKFQKNKNKVSRI